MKFVNNEDSETVNFGHNYNEEHKNILSLLLANKKVRCHDLRLWQMREDQTIFEVIDGEVTVELIELDKGE